MRVRTLFAILTIMLGIKANATNYYFSDSDGDDSRSTSQAQNPSTPWRSLSKLNSFFPYLQPGDKVFFKMGDTFYGSLTTTKSGTTSSPIVLSSYGSGDAKPTFSGFSTATGWNSLGNGIYESDPLPAGSSVNMVVINGQQYAMGRFPNANSSNGGYLTFESHGYNSITDNNNPLDYRWTKAQLVVRAAHGAIVSSTVTDVSGNTISYSPALDHGLTDKFGYFVQNHIKTLDQFGEWYYNPSTHKLAVYFGSNNPSKYTVQASTIDILLTAHSSNIVLDNLRFRGANSYGIYADWKDMSNIQLKNCRVVFSGIDGLALSGTIDFSMENCSVQNSNSNGIDLHYNNNNPTIKYTTIKNTATFNGMMKKDVGSRYGMGIYSSQGVTVQNCNIINSGWIAINYAGNNNLIQNNYIDNFCTLVDDGAGIYTYTGKSNTTYYNRRVIGNIVINGIGAKAGTYDNDPNYNPVEGIYCDDNSTNVQILNNTVANCGNSGVYVHNGRGIVIRNNVLYNNYIQLAFQGDALGYGVSGGIVARNQLFSKSASQLIMMLQSNKNDFTNFGFYDSNYYCRPFKEDAINYTNWFYNKDGFYNLSGWQSTYGKDWHTKKTPVPVSDESDILFEYNASTSTRTIKLNGTYIGLNSVKYTENVELAPYTSIILLRTSGSNKLSASSNMTASASAMVTPSTKSGYVESTNLTVKAYPNPSSNYFNVTTHGNNAEPMTLRVIDLSGKLVQVKTGINANSTLQVGQDLAPGSYILELIQGNKKVEQKAIKLTK